MHPRFDALRPRVIDVRPVENETVRPLDRVSFGGLAQRLITGPREYDVPGLLHHALLKVLEEKGYGAETGLSVAHSPGVDFRLPSEGAIDTPFDAVLFTRILSWSVSRVTTTRVSLGLRVELYAVPGGELLFDHELKGFIEDEDPASDGTFLAPGLRRVAYRALADLPRCEDPPGNPSLASGRRSGRRAVAE
ncbi:MAG: hypothetical protein JXA90_07885 [Planctomycetes bacterium]|nr:hypothetical protein [Planctomycetota bacterium]